MGPEPMSSCYCLTAWTFDGIVFIVPYLMRVVFINLTLERERLQADRSPVSCANITHILCCGLTWEALKREMRDVYKSKVQLRERDFVQKVNTLSFMRTPIDEWDCATKPFLISGWIDWNVWVWRLVRMLLLLSGTIPNLNNCECRLAKNIIIHHIYP